MVSQEEGDLCLNPGFIPGLIARSQTNLFFSPSLSFLNSKMEMVTTVLYLLFKVIGKLIWDRGCEILDKL